MDESNESGFKWILARLSDGLRQKYCSQALQEELDDVQTQLAKCSEGMAHAVQVEDAIASLQANQISNAPVRARTYSVARLLAELQALQHSLESKMATLLQPLTEMPDDVETKHLHADNVPSAASRRPNEERPESQPAVSEESDVYADVRKLLQKMQKIVRKHRGDSWVADAVDLVRAVAKSYPDDTSVAKKTRKAWKHHIINSLEPLRTVLLDHTTEHGDQLPRFRKALKKLAKCNADLTRFCEESEAILVEKEQKLAAKEQRKAGKAARKKRKWSDASSTTSSVALPLVKEETSTPAAPMTKKLTIAEVRPLLTLCSREVRLLRDRFEMASFDVNLNRLVDAADSLSAEFTYDDVSTLVTSLFALAEHVEKVAQPIRRKNRLLRVEAVLKILIASTYIPMSNRRRAIVQEYLTNCQEWLRAFQSTSGNGETSKASPRVVATPIAREAERAKRTVKPAIAPPQPAAATKVTRQQQRQKRSPTQVLVGASRSNNTRANS